MSQLYTVWVGGIADAENVGIHEAIKVAMKWLDQGYDDVAIETMGGVQ